MIGPSIESVLHLVVTSEPHTVTAEVEMDGTRYTLRKWRGGIIVLRPIR